MRVKTVLGLAIVILALAVPSTVRADTTYTYTINPSSGGVVTSNPAGLNCGSTCTASFTGGSTVQLNATPSAGRLFSNWSGSRCRPATVNPCSFVMPFYNDPYPTGANFGYQIYHVTVNKEGSGSGTVAGNAGSFAYGSTVNLTATPAAGSVFVGWDVNNLGPTGSNLECYNYGKGEVNSINPSRTCSFNFDDLSSPGTPNPYYQNYSATAIFNAAAQAPPKSNGAPPAGAPTSSGSPTPSPSSAPSSTPTPSSATASGVTLQRVAVDGKTVPQDCSLRFTSNQTMSISGTTVPDGTVNLTVHSKLRRDTVKADASGHWSYSITGLELGEHHIDAFLTDSQTHKTYTSATLISFSVIIPSSNGGPAHYPAIWLVLVLALLAALLVLSGPRVVRRMVTWEAFSSRKNI